MSRSRASSNSGWVAVVRHRRLVEVVGLGDVVEVPAGEERREGQLGKHDEVAALGGGLGEHHAQSIDDGPRSSARCTGPNWAAPTVTILVIPAFCQRTARVDVPARR